ncbi:TOPRIM domain protein (fragment) [Hyella patelloides LEGE 07179]|uniref:TOPRIM domain protein n=1 Tax=Hyella patelloides LEGE 07179 TaxID=945734 RepID=A0A563W4R7_9CYAN
MSHRDEELERFKREIPLVDFALSYGYSIDKKKTSKNSLCLKKDSDKILVGRDSVSRAHIYTSLTDPLDKGTIIDFVQHRRQCNLGYVRKELRQWLGTAKHHTRHQYQHQYQLSPELGIKQDRAVIREQLAQCSEVLFSPFLRSRKLHGTLLKSARFKDTVLADTYNNLIFPHQDVEGICGFEKRNANYKGFSTGGEKGLWVSNTFKEDKYLVICESPIDCLSHAQLYPRQDTRYMATSGSFSAKQKDLLVKASEKMKLRGGRTVLALDNDAAGYKMRDELQRHIPDAVVRFPEQHKDWNEQLQRRQQQQMYR